MVLRKMETTERRVERLGAVLRVEEDPGKNDMEEENAREEAAKRERWNKMKAQGARSPFDIPRAAYETEEDEIKRDEYGLPISYPDSYFTDDVPVINAPALAYPTPTSPEDTAIPEDMTAAGSYQAWLNHRLSTKMSQAEEDEMWRKAAEAPVTDGPVDWMEAIRQDDMEKAESYALFMGAQFDGQELECLAVYIKDRESSWRVERST